MKHLIRLLVLSLCAIFASCDSISDEPVIEGKKVNQVVGAQAQSFVLKITNYSGKPYDRKSTWRIVGIRERNDDMKYPIVNNILNVLPDRSIQISYDWMTCTVPPLQDEIHVTVTENTTGKIRRLTFWAEANKTHGPTFTVEQKAEKD